MFVSGGYFLMAPPFLVCVCVCLSAKQKVGYLHAVKHLFVDERWTGTCMHISTSYMCFPPEPPLALFSSKQTFAHAKLRCLGDKSVCSSYKKAAGLERGGDGESCVVLLDCWLPPLIVQWLAFACPSLLSSYSLVLRCGSTLYKPHTDV